MIQLPLENILDVHRQSPIPTIILDRRDVILVFNAPLEAITGLDGKYLPDMASLVDNLCTDSDACRKLERLVGQSRNRRGSIFVEECRMALSDGSERNVELSIYASGEENTEHDILVLKFMDITGRVKAQTALSESEERFRKLFNIAPISLWEYDCGVLINRLDDLRKKYPLDYRRYLDDHPEELNELISTIRVVDVNDYTLKLYGAESREEILKPWAAGDAQSQANMFKEVFATYIEGGDHYETETVNLTIDGRIINILLRIEFPKKELGYERAIASVTDITNLKKAERALRESESKFRGFIEQSSDGMLILDSTGRIAEWNAAMERITGVPMSDAVGQFIWDFEYDHLPEGMKSDEHQATSRMVIEEALKNGGSGWFNSPFEARLAHADGSIRTIREISFPIPTGEGFVIGGIVTDITPRVIAEERLRDSEERFRGFVEETVDGVMLIDERGVVSEWNRGMTEITGYEHDEAVGMTVGEILLRLAEDPGVFPGVTVSTGPEFFDAIESGSTSVMSIVRADGTRRMVWRSIFPIRSGKGRLGGGIFRDITEISRHETQRRALNRIRDEVIRMRGAGDLERVLDIIGEALVDVGLEYKVGEINVVNLSDEVREIRAYEIRPVAGWRTYLRETEVNILADFWKRGETVYRPDILSRDIYGELDLITDLYGHVRSVLDVPFSHGTIALNSEKTDAFSKSDIAFIEEIAVILTEGFTRSDDLMKISFSENRFRSLVEQPDDTVVMLLGTNGRVIYISPQIERFTGLSPMSILSSADVLEHSIHPEDLAGYRETIPDAMNGESQRNIELRLKDSLGDYAWFTAAMFPVRDSGGNVEMVEIVFQDISERKWAEDQIRKSLDEKEILLREIHHRVKNNMQVISSLLMLQADRIDERRYHGIFRESVNRIHTMALIHTMLYQSENLSFIDLSDYIGSVTSNIASMYSREAAKIVVSVVTDNIRFDVDTAIPCGLIINELVSNAFKYAFPGDMSGRITITFIDNGDNSITLSVADTGVGLPHAIDLQSVESLGLKIVKLLAEQQLGGTISLRRDEGTEFIIQFKR